MKKMMLTRDEVLDSLVEVNRQLIMSTPEILNKTRCIDDLIKLNDLSNVELIRLLGKIQREYNIIIS